MAHFISIWFSSRATPGPANINDDVRENNIYEYVADDLTEENIYEHVPESSTRLPYPSPSAEEGDYYIL